MIARLRSFAVRFLESAPSLQFLAWFALIGLVKFDTIFEPPVWDAAMGAFPPAIFLYESGFDIQALLQQGNWWQGGPNVHSLSLFTWFVAAVMWLTESPESTFAIVHLTTFAMVALALVFYTRALRRDDFEPGLILISALFLISLPIVLVQIGYLYTETWVMAFSLFAWAAWREGHPRIAVLVGGAALFVKLTGIAIAACIGLALVLMATRRPLSKKHLALLPLLPAALYTVRSLPRWLGAASVPGPSWGDADYLSSAMFDRLAAIPDVTLLILLGMLASMAYTAIIIARGARFPALVGATSATTGRLIALAMPFVFALGVVGSIFSQILFLPRYLIPVLPFAILSILFLAQSLRREALATGLLTAGTLLSLLNYNGGLYTPEFASFSVVERSHAYKQFHRVQTDLIDAIIKRPEGLPVFVSKEIHYMLSHPMMGYVEGPVGEVRPLFRPEAKGRPIDDFPSEFLLAYSNPGHGGEEAARLAQIAEARPDIELRARPFEHKGFHTTLFWIRRQDPEARGAEIQQGRHSVAPDALK